MLKLIIDTNIGQSTKYSLPIGNLMNEITVNWGDGNEDKYKVKKLTFEELRIAKRNYDPYVCDVHGDCYKIYRKTATGWEFVGDDIDHSYRDYKQYEICVNGAFKSLRSGINYADQDGRDKLISVVEWDVPCITHMDWAFAWCTSLTSVPNFLPETVVNLNGMFRNAVSFNQDISNWNIHNIDTCSLIFRDATSFNQDLNNWDMSNVRWSERMFDGAAAFNIPLTKWQFRKFNVLYCMFRNSGLSVENHSKMIAAWADNDKQGDHVTYSVGDIGLDDVGRSAWDKLVSEKAWHI